MGGIAAAARPVRDHGRRRRQLRLPRDPASSSTKLREGYDLVQGCRLPSGRRHGPARAPCRSCTAGSATRCSRAWRGAGSARRSTTSTAGCAASREAVRRALDQRCTGMEFATEMIIKASLSRRADRRGARSRCTRTDARSHPPHLRTFRDGWRTLRFFLHVQPALAVPDARAVPDRCSGCSATRWRCPGCTSAASRFDAHTLLFASLAIIVRLPVGAVRACSPRPSPSARG